MSSGGHIDSSNELMRWFRQFVALALFGPLVAARADEDGALFREQVAPLFEQHCVGCHQGATPKGGLSLTDRAGALAGGESGPAIVPGKPDEGTLLRNVSGDAPQMPKDAKPLDADRVAAIRAWIAAGAQWPEGLALRDRNAARDRHWWSLLPLEHSRVPRLADSWIRTPVDAFILEKLREQGLTPSPEADRRTLIRRLSYDLHGLPPTPEEIDAFLVDARVDAYERLVERLLASPRYGERFGRYWLDIVHYGESHGYDKDKPRPHAWPYRDWVIRSLNDDLPYDRFMAQQLAGDVLEPGDPRTVAATGFIAAGPWDFVGHVELREGTADKDIARSNDRDDMVAGAMSTFLSLTVHCARCHDHKFDPITQQDYYALQAVFAGVDRADRELGVAPAVAQARLRLTAEKTALENRLNELRPKAEGVAAPPELADVERASAEATRCLGELPPARYVFAAANQFAPQGSFVPAAAPRPIHLLVRGDVRSPGPLVSPAALACVVGPDPIVGLSPSDDESRRRLALARWLADPRNALVRRSIVNRVWQFHFGQGIVDTPNDFGRMGSPPTHPELLEWLAGRLIDDGHSLKAMHRLLLTSAVYRQSSAPQQEYARVDSNNRYLWRANRSRLDAECVRDAMLAVCGRLDPTMGGPSLQQFYFKDDHSPVYDYTRFDVDDPRSLRRGVYRFLVRSVPDPFMECLDCADPSIMTPKRNTTLTSIQALALLNNPFTTRAAEHFAARLRATADDPAARIRAAYLLALGRPPTDGELAAVAAYAEAHGLENACRALFNSNEFMFVD
jgi:mono/diheme cytochrome c family protein